MAKIKTENFFVDIDYVCFSNYASLDTIQSGISRKLGITCFPFIHSSLVGYLPDYLIFITENCFEVSDGRILPYGNLGSSLYCLRVAKISFGLDFIPTYRVDARMYNFDFYNCLRIYTLSLDLV